MHDPLRLKVSKAAGKKANPTAAVVHLQSAKTTETDDTDVDYCGGKKIKGRKRHTAVESRRRTDNTDTLVQWLGVQPHSADRQDQNGAPLVLCVAWQVIRSIKIVFGDSAYERKRSPKFAKDTDG